MDIIKHDIAVLGSTGSVGTQTLETARRLGLRVRLLTASSSVGLIEAQAREFCPDAVALSDAAAAASLKIRLSDTKIEVSDDPCYAVAAFGEKYKQTATALDAVTGIAGLAPAMTAARCGIRIAMANKEAIVTAGGHLFKAAAENGAEMIPVDSEHSAIFRCLEAVKNKSDVSKLLLTASGGAFYGRGREYLRTVTAKQALAHPTWRMGKKITVDSATLMNKGFEIIEAVRLFGVPEDRVEVVVQCESVIHSMIETRDGSVIAQLGAPDMQTCIAYALTYPDCADKPAAKLDFTKLTSLTFGQPDTAAFPLLDLARYAIRRDGVVPTALNAADEVAVSAFLDGCIGLCEVFDVVEKITVTADEIRDPSLEDIARCDSETRIKARELIGCVRAAK